MKENDKVCLVCRKSHQEIPLTSFDYKNTKFWICPQDIPILIHNPHKLAGLLPDADTFGEAGHHH